MNGPPDMHGIIQFLSDWAAAQPRGYRTGGGGEDAVDYLQFHYRPDPDGPEAQLTFRADLYDGRPVIRVQLPAHARADTHTWASSSATAIAIVGRTDPPLREPSATCESCGAIGTVGRAIRTDERGDATEVHRFCFSCWPEQSARYRARWEEENRLAHEGFLRRREPRPDGSGGGMTFEAATWHGTLEFLREIKASMVAPVPPSRADLERIAADIRDRAPEVEGEMPFEVEAFLRRYGTTM